MQQSTDVTRSLIHHMNVFRPNPPEHQMNHNQSLASSVRDGFADTPAMKSSHSRNPSVFGRTLALIAVATCLVFMARPTQAQITLTANDASGSSSFNAAGHWSNDLAPTAGDTYSDTNFVLRGPASTTPYTFAGNSLTFSGTAEFLGKTAGTQTLTINDLIMDGGNVREADANGTAATETIAGNMTVEATTTLSALPAETVNISANIAGSANIQISGTGVTGAGSTSGSLANEDYGLVILSGNNSSYTGNINIGSVGTGGMGTTLQAGSTTAFGTTSAISLANIGPTTFSTYTSTGAVLDMNNNSNSIGSLAGGGTSGGNVYLEGATLTIGGNNTNTTYAGGISGATGGSLIKVGTGTQTLSGTSTYTGSTTVSGGTLLVTGTLSATTAVSANTGGLLEVDGSVNNAVTIEANGSGVQGNGTIGGAALVSGTLSPGLDSALGTPAAGTLTADGDVSLDSASTFSIRLGVQTYTDSDQLLISNGGQLTLNDTPLQLTIGSALASYGGSVGNLYTIVDGGYTSGDFSYDGTTILDDQTITDGGDTFTVLYGADGNGGTAGNVELQLTAASVPEPGTWASLLGGLVMLVAWQRRRTAGCGPAR
jgi:autotransporter-associated beta strand protein